MSDVELVKFASLNDYTDPSGGGEDPSINGDLLTENSHEVLELVYLDKEGSGPQEYSVRFSATQSAQSPDHDAQCDGEVDSLLQTEVLRS